MKIALLAIFTALTLTACASPETLREKKPQLEVSSKKSSKDFMHCVAASFEELSSMLRVNVRPTKDGYQIGISDIMVGTTAYDMVDINDAGSGSTAKYYSASVPAVVERFVKPIQGCK